MSDCDGRDPKVIPIFCKKQNEALEFLDYVFAERHKQIDYFVDMGFKAEQLVLIEYLDDWDPDDMLTLKNCSFEVREILEEEKHLCSQMPNGLWLLTKNKQRSAPHESKPKLRLVTRKEPMDEM